MKKVRIFLTGLLMTMAVALGGCTGDKTAETPVSSAENADGSGYSATGQITIGIAQDLDDGLDPHKVDAAGTREILFNVYEGLVKYDVNGNLVPAVASDYAISPDGLTYTFTLREGVLFHDGNAVTPDDVIYSLSRCADTSNGEALKPALTNISFLQANDEGKVVIKLNEPDPDFLSYMTTAIIPAWNTDPETNVVGTGPYKFVSHTPQESVVLEAFDGYWGEKAHIKDVTLKVIANPDSIVMEMMGGSVDMFCRVTDEQAKELEAGDFNIATGTMNLVQALYLNNSYEPFQDERVRQAICYAIDPDEIMAYVSGGEGTEIATAVFPAFGRYYDASLNDNYNKDVEKAKELLKEAGYENSLEFSITVPSNYQPHVATAEVLVEQLKAVGVNASIELVDWDTWLSGTYSERNYQATVIGVDANPLTARALLERYRSDAGNNFMNYNNPDFDAKLDAAFATYDDEEQTKLFKECLSILSETAASAYIQDLPCFVAVRKNIAGYQFYPLYAQDFASLYFTDAQ